MTHTCFILWTMVMVTAVISDKDTAEEVGGYNFQYTVSSDTDNVHYGHAEDRHGYHTRGSYRVLLPDGRTQVVEYRVKDRDSGYAVKVSYTGVALVDTVQHNQPREKYKDRKREISAGSYSKPVKIKPYRRHNEHQGDDIFTTTVPDTTESITVSSSPELVTAAPTNSFDTVTATEKNTEIEDYSATLVTVTDDDNHQTRNYDRFIIGEDNEKTNQRTHIGLKDKIPLVDTSENKVINGGEHLDTRDKYKSTENIVLRGNRKQESPNTPGTYKHDKSTEKAVLLGSKKHGSEFINNENEAPITSGTYKHDKSEYFDHLESTEYDKQTASVITVEKPSIMSKPSAEHTYYVKHLIEEKTVTNDNDYMTNQNTNLHHSPINPYAYTVYKPTLNYYKRPKQIIPQGKSPHNSPIFYNKKRFQQIPVIHGIPRISIPNRNVVSSKNTKTSSRRFASPAKKPFFSFNNWFPFKF